MKRLSREHEVENALKHIAKIYGFFDVKLDIYSDVNLFTGHTHNVCTCIFVKDDPKTCAKNVINNFGIIASCEHNKSLSSGISVSIFKQTFENVAETLERFASDGYTCEVYGIGNLIEPNETFEQAMIRLELQANTNR